MCLTFLFKVLPFFASMLVFARMCTFRSDNRRRGNNICISWQYTRVHHFLYYQYWREWGRLKTLSHRYYLFSVSLLFLACLSETFLLLVMFLYLTSRNVVWVSYQCNCLWAEFVCCLFGVITVEIFVCLLNLLQQNYFFLNYIAFYFHFFLNVKENFLILSN